mgnify:FL=1
MNKIRVAVCDDMEEFCYYLRNCILFCEELDFAGMAHSGTAGVALCAEQKPDVLLLDMQMETYSAGADVIPEIKRQSPDTKIIIFTIHNESRQIFSALANGADDYILKTAPIDEIVSEIINVYNNRIQLKPEITNSLLSECIKTKSENQSLIDENTSLLYVLNTVTKLTVSEYSILEDLCNDLTYNDIAKKRYVEATTIRSQTSRISKKFNCKDMASLVKFMKELKIFEIIKRANKIDK